MAKLVVSFVSPHFLEEFLGRLRSYYELGGEFFIVYKIQGSNNLLVSYNISLSNVGVLPEGSVVVHRKAQYSCYYTINGLNAIIREKTAGDYDPNYRVNWEEYENTFITYKNGVLRIQKISFDKRLEI